MCQRFTFNLNLSFPSNSTRVRPMSSANSSVTSAPRARSPHSDFGNLASSALVDGSEVRPALLAALTDLFVSREQPDGEEIARFEDMALRLIGDSDAGTRAHVAARLAKSRFAPVSVIDALLQVDRACATILLEHCQRLSPELLSEIAQSGTAEEARILARRHDLDTALIGTLSLHEDDRVLVALVENPDAPIEGQILNRLMARARESENLARALCRRFSDSRIVAPLFLSSSAEQRAEILRDAEFASFSVAQLKRVETASDVLIDWIVARGRQGLWGLVAQEIARLTGFERKTVDRLLADEQGDGLAILMAAIGCPVEKAIRLFLACAPAISHSYPRVKALAHVVEHMPAHAAYRLIHDITGTQMDAPRRPVHVPLADPTAVATPSRPRSGLSAHQMPAPRALRKNPFRLQR